MVIGFTRQPFDPVDPLLRTEEVAHLLNVSPRTVEDWRYRGGGPPYRRFRRAIRYVRSEVLAYMDRYRED